MLPHKKNISMSKVADLFQVTVSRLTNLGLEVESNLEIKGHIVKLSIKADNLLKPPPPGC